MLIRRYIIIEIIIRKSQSLRVSESQSSKTTKHSQRLDYKIKEIVPKGEHV